MVTATFANCITTLAELREIVGAASEGAIKKDVGQIDRYCRAFLARSPFALLGTANAAGRCDVSPRGDVPGFALVLDEHTLALPERAGNRRLDTLSNLIENPQVGLLFIVPGMEETLRINGAATLVRDPDLLDRMAVNGKPAMLAIVIEVREAYLHCAKAFKRARLWDPASQALADEVPTAAEIFYGQMHPDCTLEELDRNLKRGYETLY